MLRRNAINVANSAVLECTLFFDIAASYEVVRGTGAKYCNACVPACSLAYVKTHPNFTNFMHMLCGHGSGTMWPATIIAVYTLVIIIIIVKKLKQFKTSCKDDRACITPLQEAQLSLSDRASALSVEIW